MRLEFLTEPGAIEVLLGKGTKEVQEDLKAAVFAGLGIALDHSEEVKVTGTISDGSECSSKLRVAAITSALATKGDALGRPRKVEKDCYDVYAICGFAGRNPAESAKMFDSTIDAHKLSKMRSQYLRNGLERIRDYFGGPNHKGRPDGT